MINFYKYNLFSKVPLFSVTNINKAISHFKSNDFWITSFENNIEAKNWYSIDLKGRSVLIFGGEGSGISKQILRNSDFLAINCNGDNLFRHFG